MVWVGNRWSLPRYVDGPTSAELGHTGDSVGTNNSVAVYNNQLHVFTQDTTSGSLRHDGSDGHTWHFETLDGPGSTWAGHTTHSVATDNAIAVYGGQLHVFTRDSDTGALHQDWWS